MNAPSTHCEYSNRWDHSSAVLLRSPRSADPNRRDINRQRLLKPHREMELQAAVLATRAKKQWRKSIRQRPFQEQHASRPFASKKPPCERPSRNWDLD